MEFKYPFCAYPTIITIYEIVSPSYIFHILHTCLSCVMDILAMKFKDSSSCPTQPRR